MWIMLWIGFVGFMIWGQIYSKHREKKKLEKLNEDLKLYEENLTRINGFNPTERIVSGICNFGVFGIGIWIDFNSKKVAMRSATDETTPKIYSFDSIKSCEFSGDCIDVSKVKRTEIVTNSFAHSLNVDVSLVSENGANTLILPLFEVSEFEKKMNVRGSDNKTSGENFQKAFICAEAIKAELDLIATRNSKAYSVADDIGKYAKMLDEGILTQDEFNAKKKQLLAL